MSVGRLSLIVNFFRVLSSPLNLYFTLKLLSPEEQGLYYGMLSLLTLQSVFEIGLPAALSQTCGHDYSGLSWRRDRLEGDDQAVAELGGLLKNSVRLASLSSVIFLFTLQIGALQGFSKSQASWQGPWILLSLCASLRIVLNVLVSILEGCQQYVAVQKARLAEVVVAPIFGWIAFLTGRGLYSPPLQIAVGLGFSTYLVAVHYGRPLRFLLSRANPDLSWRRKMWPLQARQILATLVQVPFLTVTYFVGLKVNLEEAGRFGLAWALCSLQSVFTIGYQSAHDPLLAAHAARGESQRVVYLSRLFFFRTCLFWLVYFSSLTLGLQYLHSAYPRVAGRIASQEVFFYLAAGAFIINLTSHLHQQSRVYKQEPYIWLNGVYTALFVVGGLINPNVTTSEDVSRSYLLSLLAALPGFLWIGWKRTPTRLYRRVST